MWDPILMKKLLKSEICGSRALFTDHKTDKKKLKSQLLPATVHMLSPNWVCSSRIKKKKIEET